jgi:hypothetical protein
MKAFIQYGITKLFLFINQSQTMTSLTDWTYVEEIEPFDFELLFDSSHFIATLLFFILGSFYLIKFAVGVGSEGAHIATVRALLLVFFTVLLSQLIHASLTLPNRKNDESLYKWDCLYSHKGGKVSYDDSNDPNPCFCANGNVTGTLSKHNSDGSIGCSTKIQSFHFLDGTRDCSNARGPQCSKTSPCTPCELSKSEDFGDDWTRCQSCTNPYQRRCNFVEGLGPYCYQSSAKTEVVRCNECCTDPEPYFDENGTCY